MNVKKFREKQARLREKDLLRVVRLQGVSPEKTIITLSDLCDFIYLLKSKAKVKA